MTDQNSNCNECDVVSIISKFDIIGLQETFLKSSDNISEKFSQVESDYIVHVVNRDITHRRAKRGAGGVALLYKKSIQKGIEVMATDHQDIVWLRAKASFF